MNVSMYPLITMTYCFIQPPPPGSICNCTTPPPNFTLVFPTNPMATTESTVTTSIGLETTADYKYTHTGSTPSSSVESSTLINTGAITTDTITTSNNLDGEITSIFSSSSGGTDAIPLSPSAKPVTDTDNDIWPIIIAVIFGVVLVACIIAFLIWYFKKYIVAAQCKVHPDGTFDEEKTPPDMTEVENLDDDKCPVISPSPHPPSAPAVGAVAAVGAGASPTVKKLYKKGSVELKPLGKPVPPVHKASIILDPSNLAEQETDHPQPNGNSNENNTADEKPKKKKKKKKKKKQTATNDIGTGDTNLGYDNTEDLPNG